LITKLGGTIVYRSAGSGDVRESIRVDGEGRFTVYLSSITSAERDRFTIAHELGHYVLHFPMVRRKYEANAMIATRWVDEDDPEQKRAEWEANGFAAAFLMPEDSFKEQFHRNRSIPVVANIFGVSAQAAEVRAKTLGLV
jgi:Zn-dependent peptidase ImmA (M78 family)